MNMFRTAAAIAILAAGALTSTAASALDRSVLLINSSDRAITDVFFSDVDNDWGYAVNGRTLRAYQEAWVDPSSHRGYCMFDMMVEYADGSTSTLWDFNACEAWSVEFNDRGIVITDIDSERQYIRF